MSSQALEEALKSNNSMVLLEFFEEVAQRNFDHAYVLVPGLAMYVWNPGSNEELRSYCAKFLDVVAFKVTVKETDVFAHCLDVCDNDKMFMILLKPVKMNLKKEISVNGFIVLKLSAIQDYLEKIVVKWIDEELLDRTELLYNAVIDVYRDIFMNFTFCLDNVYEVHLINGFIRLLSKPLSFFPVETPGHIVQGISEDIVKDVLSRHSNPFDIVNLSYTDEFNYYAPDKVSLAVFMYTIFSSEDLRSRIPQIFSVEYIFEQCLPLVSELMDTTHHAVIQKSLDLTQFLINRIKPHLLSADVLNPDHQHSFFTNLERIIIRTDSEKIRKQGVQLFENYLKCFDSHGVYLIIYNLMTIFTHSGLIGFTIGQYKEFLHKELSTTTTPSKYFRGTNLLALVRRFCRLPKLEDPDWVGCQEQTMAVLNLLLYLTIRDKNNITGIWDLIPSLQKTYVKELRKGLELTRRDFNRELKDQVENFDEERNKKDHEIMSAMVNDQELPEMDLEEKVRILRMTLTGMDMIDNVLSRLVECIKQHQN